MGAFFKNIGADPIVILKSKIKKAELFSNYFDITFPEDTRWEFAHYAKCSYSASTLGSALSQDFNQVYKDYSFPIYPQLILEYLSMIGIDLSNIYEIKFRDTVDNRIETFTKYSFNTCVEFTVITGSIKSEVFPSQRIRFIYYPEGQIKDITDFHRNLGWI